MTELTEARVREIFREELSTARFWAAVEGVVRSEIAKREADAASVAEAARAAGREVERRVVRSLIAKARSGGLC